MVQRSIGLWCFGSNGGMYRRAARMLAGVRELIGTFHGITFENSETIWSTNQGVALGPCLRGVGNGEKKTRRKRRLCLSSFKSEQIRDELCDSGVGREAIDLMSHELAENVERMMGAGALRAERDAVHETK